MADEHKQQAAALLAVADEVHAARSAGDPSDELERHARDLRQEALVHAVLQVADEISLLVAATTR